MRCPQKKALLAVSNGTSHIDAMHTIELMRNQLQIAFPDRHIALAFTSQTIREKLNYAIKSVPETLQSMINEGIEDIIIQPLLIVKGKTYQQMSEEASHFKEHFKHFFIGEVLLNTPKATMEVANIFKTSMPKCQPNEAVIGIAHDSKNQSYQHLNELLNKDQIYIIPLKKPVPKWLQERYHTIWLTPFMLVAGYHFTKDMMTICRELKNNGINVVLLNEGLGKMPRIREKFVQHAKEE